MIILITYLLNVYDLVMTTLWINRYGLSIECNPIGRWLFAHNVAWVVKIFVVGALLALMGVCIRKRPQLAWAAYIPLTVYAALAAYHIVIANIVL